MAAARHLRASEAGTVDAAAAVPFRLVGGGVVPLGALIALVAAWAALAPYAGPTFGYRIDSAPSWHWNLAHALLGLVPGAVCFVAALFLIGSARSLRLGRDRVKTVTAALVVAVCGAWLVVGPFTWPVLYRVAYFRPAGPLGTLSAVVGSTVGPGVLLGTLAGMAMSVARHGGAVLRLGDAGVTGREDRLAQPVRLVTDPAEAGDTGDGDAGDGGYGDAGYGDAGAASTTPGGTVFSSEVGSAPPAAITSPQAAVGPSAAVETAAIPPAGEVRRA